MKKATDYIITNGETDLFIELHRMLKSNKYMNDMFAYYLREHGAKKFYSKSESEMIDFISDISAKDLSAARVLIENVILQAVVDPELFRSFIRIIGGFRPNTNELKLLLELMPVDLSRSFYLDVEPEDMVFLITWLTNYDREKSRKILLDYWNDVGLSPFSEEDMEILVQYLEMLRLNIPRDRLIDSLRAQQHQLVKIIDGAANAGADLNLMNKLMATLMTIDIELLANIIGQLSPVNMAKLLSNAYKSGDISPVRTFYGQISTLMTNISNTRPIILFTAGTLYQLFKTTFRGSPSQIFASIDEFVGSAIASRYMEKIVNNVTSRCIYNYFRTMPLTAVVREIGLIASKSQTMARRLLLTLIKDQNVFPKIVKKSNLSGIVELIDKIFLLFPSEARMMINQIYTLQQYIFGDVFNSSDIDDLALWIKTHKDRNIALSERFFEPIKNKLKAYLTVENFSKVIDTIRLLGDINYKFVVRMLEDEEFVGEIMDILLYEEKPESIKLAISKLLQLGPQLANKVFRYAMANPQIMAKIYNLPTDSLLEILQTLYEAKVEMCGEIARMFIASEHLDAHLKQLDAEEFGRMLIVISNIDNSLAKSLFDRAGDVVGEYIDSAESLRKLARLTSGLERIRGLANLAAIDQKIRERARDLIQNSGPMELLDIITVVSENKTFRPIYDSAKNRLKSIIIGQDINTVLRVIYRLRDHAERSGSTQKLLKEILKELGKSPEMMERFRSLPKTERANLVSALMHIDTNFAKKIGGTYS